MAQFEFINDERGFISISSSYLVNWIKIIDSPTIGMRFAGITFNPSGSLVVGHCEGGFIVTLRTSDGGLVSGESYGLSLYYYNQTMSSITPDGVN